jgi:hypothetical protein
MLLGSYFIITHSVQKLYTRFSSGALPSDISSASSLFTDASSVLRSSELRSTTEAVDVSFILFLVRGKFNSTRDYQAGTDIEVLYQVGHAQTRDLSRNTYLHFLCVGSDLRECAARTNIKRGLRHISFSQ